MRNDRNFLFWLILAFTILFVSRVYSYPTEFQAVCQIEESGGQGSGTLVASNAKASLILTVRHVIKQPGHPDMFLWLTANGKPTSGVTLENMGDPKSNWWESSDLALAICHKPFDGKGRPIIPAKVGIFDSDKGPWYGVGYVSGSRKIIEIRHIEYKASTSLLWCECLFIPGMSGGPVFDRTGKVVGVISSYNRQYGLSWAISSPNLQKILDLYGL